MASIFANLRYALRQLKKSPGFTMTAVLTLALGIGASTAIFTLFDQALLKSLPVKDPQQLVLLRFSGDVDGHTHAQGGDARNAHPYFSYPMYRDLRAQSKAFDGLLASARADFGVSWHGYSEAVSGELVSGNYFRVLGIQPAIGRLFADGDETAPGANPVAVLSFDYWKTQFHLDPSIIGQTLDLNGTPFTVIGVSAPSFQSVVWGDRPKLFLPMTMQRAVDSDDDLTDRHSFWLKIIGRLPAGETAKQAESSLGPLWNALREMEFKTLPDQSEHAHIGYVTQSRLELLHAASGFYPSRGDNEMPMMILLGMVLLVLAMVAVNVASLLLVRAARRVREFSMRYALGATTGDIVRQLLVEGLLLGTVGSALGVFLAPQIMKLLVARVPSMMPNMPSASGPDLRVLGFALGVSLLVSLLFSLAPALQFLKPNLVDSLKQQSGTGTTGSLSFRRTCVGLQISFSLMLLIGAGLFARTIQNLRSVNTGFNTERLMQFYLDPEMAGYKGDAIPAVEQRVLDALEALPGVRGVAATNDPELANDGIGGGVDIAGYTPKPDETVEAELPSVSRNYFQVMGIPLVAGRGFTQADSATAQKVSVVNEMFARKYFGSPQNALGHHVSRPHRANTDTMIVGVVKDSKHASVRDEVLPTVYRPFVQSEGKTGLEMYIRTWQSPEATSRSIRVAVQNIDSKLIVDDLRTIQSQIDETISTERFIGTLATAFGLLAAALAGIGLYGVLAYSTAQRTREIGIRMALGAQRLSVAKLILREVLILSAVAVVVTLPVAYGLSRLLRAQLFGISPADPLVYAGGILMIGVVASLAALLPARRAASVEPMQALRTE